MKKKWGSSTCQASNILFQNGENTVMEASKNPIVFISLWLREETEETKDSVH